MAPQIKRMTKNDFKTFKPNTIKRGLFVDIKKEEAKDIKIACVVSKKISPLAVVRNKIKRKTYSAIRENTLEKKGHYIFYPQKSILTTTHKNLVKEIQQSLLFL